MRITWVLCGISALATVACSSSDATTGGDHDASTSPAQDAGTPPPKADAASADAGVTVDAAVDAPTTTHDGGACPSPVRADPKAAARDACTFTANAHANDTLGLSAQDIAAIPITHVVVITEENRSFDHFFGKLAGTEGWPNGFTNPDASGAPVAPTHLTSHCLPADPPHQGAAMVTAWDTGKMDGFVKSAAVNGSNGHFVMGYYDQTDLPFFYWLGSTYSIADHYFAPALGGTWANRDYLYAGTSNGITDTGQAVLTKPTIFDALDVAHVPWAVYSDGTPRQDCLGWTSQHIGVATYGDFLQALRRGDLPPVSFLDPSGGQDEHPTNDVSGGEAWIHEIYRAALASPLWKELAIIFTFDEAGGLSDHVPPPAACIPSPDQSAFNRRGVRIPTIVISPWARPHYVSKVVHDHTSVLRLIEVLHDLPALTARDANADAMLDMFDFGCAQLQSPPAEPAAGVPGFCN